MKQDYLVLDIETAPHRLDEYKELFPNSKKKGGLHAIISEVVCVGMADENQISILDRQEFASEKDILVWLAKVLHESQNKQLVTFNGKNFDVPFLNMRALLYNTNLILPDSRSARHFDIYEKIGGKWQSDTSSCSLRELVWFKFGEVAETQGGNMVAEWYANGELDKIAEHCEEDIQYTRRLYLDMVR